MLVIFDLDGTLFQTALCVINAINQLFDELNLKRIPMKAITDCIGKTTYDFLQTLLPEAIDPYSCCERFRLLEQIEVAKHGILYNGVEKMLVHLKSNGHTLFICSNGSTEYINLVLSTTGIDKYIDSVVSAKIYSTKSNAVKQIIQNNSCAVLVGDTLFDIQAAVANKIPSIGVKYGYGKDGELLKSTYLAENADDISDFVNTCNTMYKVTEKIFQNPIKIVGINGIDTSGKTTFTNLYSKFLHSIGIKSTVIHIDDFHNQSEIRYCGNNEIEAYYNNAFNYGQLIDEVLQPLKNNGTLEKEIFCLDLDTNKYEKKVHISVDSSKILLVEGVLLFRPPLIDYFDAKIFLHIDFDEVIKRAEKRDVPKYGKNFLKKYIDKYIPIQKRYIDEWNPYQRADIVVNNNNYAQPEIFS